MNEQEPNKSHNENRMTKKNFKEMQVITSTNHVHY